MSDLITQLPNARAISEKIISTGQPSESQLRAAIDGGVRTVVNLRPAGEFSEYDEADLVTGMGMRYVDIPVAGPADLTKDNAERLHQALSSENGLPAIVHCKSGNRVGALIAYRARHLLWDDKETAMRKGLDAGLNPASPLYGAMGKALT